MDDDDESLSNEQLEMEISLRRASTPSGIRKLGWRSANGECGLGAQEAVWAGRRKRCVPRMRRRKAAKVEE